MKINSLSALILLFIISFASLSPAQEEKKEPSARTEPLPFLPEGMYEGGKLQKGVTLSNIRFGKDDEMRRVVFDFVTEEGGKEIPPVLLPKYRVEYKKYPYRIDVTFEGVKYGGKAELDSDYAIPLSIVSAKDGSHLFIQLFLKGPSLFKITEVDDPARLAVDSRPASYIAVPDVYALQVQGITNYSDALEFLKKELPKSFSPSIIVLGKRVIVECVYLSLGDATEAAKELETLGIKTEINERSGDEYP